MNHATDGYVTELPYSVNHFPEMAPAHLNLALLHLGLAAPALDGAFNYLELGFGQGLGLNLLAATHPQGRFFGNDFMPAHVQAAQGLATHGALNNLSLFEDSFAQLLERDLPLMDYIVLHGVYSWVSAESRAHIVTLIAKLLKPGRVVYISYNCLPGWSVKAPMQRLMSEFAERQVTGTALERYHAARDLLVALNATDAAFFTHNPRARSMLAEITNASDAYLLHEFAPKEWSPFYHTDVAQDLAAADLIYAGSARLFNNFTEYSLPPKTRALLAATPDAGLRETLRDFVVQTQLRRDTFVRGARSLSAAEIEQGMRAFRFALWRPVAACALTCQTPLGEIELDADIYEPLLQALGAGPCDINVLMQHATLAHLEVEELIEALNLLLCLGYVGIAPAQELAASSKAQIHALNRALLARVVAGERLSGLASAAVGAAIEMSYHDTLFLAAQQAGCVHAEEIATFAQNVLTPDVSNAEDVTARCHEARDFLKYADGFHRALDLFPR